MSKHPFEANFSTNIALRPVGSQILLIAMVILSGVCLVSGFIFLWYGRPSADIPLVIGILLVLGTWRAWCSSQRDIDLREAPPTLITKTPTSMEFSADARSLDSPEKMEAIAKFFSILNHREPLPEPEGVN